MFRTRFLAGLSKWARTIIFAAACLAGLMTALIGSGHGLDNRLRALRYEYAPKATSGELVLVTIDSRSIKNLGVWPWPRSRNGELVRKLDQAGAKRIAFNLIFDLPAADPAQDRKFAEAMAGARAEIFLPVLVENRMSENEASYSLPPDTLRPYATLSNVWMLSDSDQTYRNGSLNVRIGGRTLPGMAQILAQTDYRDDGEFPVDFSYTPQMFQRIAYSDVLAGRYPADFFRGKTVLVGPDAFSMGDRITVPFQGQIASLYFFAAGAETLRAGRPILVGELPGLAIAICLIAACLTLRGPWRLALLGAALLSCAPLQFLVEMHSTLRIDMAAAILALGAALFTQVLLNLFKALLDRITKSAEAGLPNLAAMELLEQGDGVTVVVSLRNYVETTALLGYSAQGKLLNKIRDRLILAAGHERIYQIDNHSFAWRSTEDVSDVVGGIEGLEALFAQGVQVDQVTVDITLNAGLCDDMALPVDQALPKAAMAANNAAARGALWERYETEEDEVFWKLTILTEFEQALESSHIWVAYQPKYDLHSQSINAAEALIRWQHPERGFIRPDRFVRAVEEGGRVEKLTLYVLERAIADFAPLGQSVSVNISTRMLGKNRLEVPIRDFLERYGMAAERLTLEITESASITDDQGIAELETLRDMGVKISIDDYGTGQSTLSYLKRLPAAELKIDQSFVRQILTSRSDAVLINSTIKLAHELDMKVVAEGVEDAPTVNALAAMECDIIQGYHFGRPVPFADYLKQFGSKDGMRRVA